MTAQEILELVEKATGPDHAIDVLLWSQPYTNTPYYTSSVDAALSLVEQMLPEFGVQVGHPIKSMRDYGWYASVFRERKPGEVGWWPGYYSGGTDDEGHHLRYYPTGPLAILAALLKALIAKEGKP